MFGQTPSVSLSSRLVEDLGIEQGSSVEDHMFDFLVDDFGWRFVKPANEATLITVNNLVNYFMVHHIENGLAISSLRSTAVQ
jgi:hypothetical protein